VSFSEREREKKILCVLFNCLIWIGEIMSISARQENRNEEITVKQICLKEVCRLDAPGLASPIVAVAAPCPLP